MSKKYNWNHLYIICFIVIIITGGCGDGGEGMDTKNTSATLSWDAPTTNTDGSELTDLVGYKVYYGTSPGNYDTVIDVEDVTTYTINDLSPATYYFAVTAYDKIGNESSYTNEVSKTIPQ